VTLFEALTALVILGLTAVGYLEVFQSGSRSAVHAHDWQRLVAEAESTMEGAMLARAPTPLPVTTSGDGYVRHVVARPWTPGVSEVVVTVTSPRGHTFALHRLVRGTPR
jgi:hypothetical protein